MTPPDEKSETTLVYFQAIEEAFIRLRGAPLMLSPADYQVVRRWFGAGIPLDFVCRALEEIFRRRSERGEISSIYSLKYCQRPVEEAWRERRELTAGASRGPVSEVPIRARLETLAKALPASLPGRRGIVEKILNLEGGAATVEERLSGLDRRLLGELVAGLNEEDRAKMLRQAEQGLSSLENRLPKSELGRLRDHLVRRALRRKLGLPLLSLFAPEVVETEGS